MHGGPPRVRRRVNDYNFGDVKGSVDKKQVIQTAANSAVGAVVGEAVRRAFNG